MRAPDDDVGDGMDGGLRGSRRALLAAGVAGAAGVLAAAGCRVPGTGRTGAAAPQHPLAGLLAGALALVARYDATISAQPALAGRLTVLRAEAWTHVTALSQAMGQAAPGTGRSPGTPEAAAGPSTALAALAAAERSAAADAVAGCLAAEPRYTALLGSIAACRATHLEVLR